jgi:type II secretory pathway component PulF
MSKKKENNKLRKKNYRRSFFRIILVGRDDIEGFLENLSLMLSVNVALYKVIESIAEETDNKTFKRALKEIAKDVDAGYTLSEAMRRARVFKEYTLELIESGETSGNLLHNLELIVKQKNKERSLRSNIFSALVYPVFVTIVGVLAGIAIFGFVLPRVTRVFAQLNIDLPWVTTQIIRFGEFLDVHGTVFIPSFLVGLFLLFMILFVFRHTKFIGQAILMKTPVIGRLVKEIELARFGFNLGTLLEAGIPLNKAVASLGNLTGMRAYRKFYNYLADEIDNGQTFVQIFNEYRKVNKLIPVPIQQIVEAGEQSASLNLSFNRIGEIFEKKTESTSKALITLLEPLLLFVVWVGVGGVALSIIVPIYSLIGNFGDRNVDPNAEFRTAQVEVVELDELEPSEGDLEEGDMLGAAEDSIIDAGVRSVEYILLVDPGLSVNLKVRSGIGTDNEILFELQPGISVEGFSLKDGWYEVLIPDGSGRIGWASGDYLTEMQDVES